MKLSGQLVHIAAQLFIEGHGRESIDAKETRRAPTTGEIIDRCYDTAEKIIAEGWRRQLEEEKARGPRVVPEPTTGVRAGELWGRGFREG